MTMIWKIKSYDTLDLDTTDYQAYLDDTQNVSKQPSTSAGSIPRGNNPPAAGGVELQGDQLTVTVETKNNSDALVNPVIMNFSTADESERPLVGYDRLGNLWYVMARPTRHISKKGVIHTFPMQVLDMVWRSVNVLNEAWTVIASAQIHDIVVGGNQVAYPRITLTARGAKTGDYAYRRFIEILNPTDRAMVDYYMDVTSQAGKGLDTAILTTAKMQAGGQDIRLVVDALERYYWLTGMDTANTGIHTCEIPLAPKIELSLSGGIAAAGAISTIQVKQTPANKLALKKLKNVKNKILRIKTGATIERFTFATADDTKYLITGVARAQKQTAETIHNDGDTIKWVEHDIWLLYGNATAAAMIVDDNRKPMQDLVNSTNTLWAWTEFYDSDVPRPGAWKRGTPTTKNKHDPGRLSDYYTGNQDGAPTNPAAELGMKMMAFKDANIWKAETATLFFEFYDPSGMTYVNFSNGEKKRVGVSWPFSAELQKSNNGTKYIRVAKELTPPTAGAFTATTVLTGAIDLGGTFRHVKILFSGSIVLSPDNAVYLEWEGVTNTKDSTEVPEINMSAEVANYMHNTTITNEENDQAITLKYPAGIDEPIVIDVSRRTVTHAGVTEILGALIRSGPWLTLEAGVTNRIRVDDPGIADVDFAIDWEDRAL